MCRTHVFRFASLYLLLCGILSVFAENNVVLAAEPIRALIIDGQNNHDWRTTTPLIKTCLESTGRFQVDIATTPEKGKPEEAWQSFQPRFHDYGVVISNYNGQSWPTAVQKSLEEYVSAGGGLVIVHAANNAFPEWAEYNKMIGLGWRGAEFGSRLIVDQAGNPQVLDKNEGPGAGHGVQHDYTVIVRDRKNPVMAGIPAEWLHVKDELYHGQRGPAASMHILATAYSTKSTGGTDEHEPMVWWIPYGKGKVFTTLLGHADYSMKCVGFQTILARGAEWVATGKVTIPVPQSFPTATEKVSISDAR